MPVQIVVAAGITLVVLAFLWIPFTLPVSSLIASYQASGVLAGDTDVIYTLAYIQWFIAAIMILVGLDVVAWGWKKTVEEREFGGMLPD